MNISAPPLDSSLHSNELGEYLDEDYSSGYDSDEPCKNRACDMGHCNMCGGNTSGGRCLRTGCDQDCSMEYEECCCDCLNCGSNFDEYLWCYCGDNKCRAPLGTITKLSLFQAIGRGYLTRKMKYN